MIHRGIAALAVLMFVALVPGGSSAVAQDQPPALSKQEVARTKFRDLTERMQKLMIVLQKDDRDANAATDAGILRAGTRYVQEARIHDHMGRVRTLLEQERWDDALVAIGDVRKKLTRLYEILQNRNEDLRKLLERIAALEAFKNRVDELAKEQGEEKEDSARTEALQNLIKEAEAKKQEAADLMAKQMELRETTNELGMSAAAEATKPLAAKEGELQEDTEELAKDLEELEAKKAELDAEAKKTGEPGKPAEGEPKPGKGGSGSAGKAAAAMGKAGEKLDSNKPEPSLKDQDHAIENLKNTIEELDDMIEDARRELLKLPFDQQAKKQEATKHATDTLSKDMEAAEEGDENGEGQPTPGKKRVQQAVPKQRAAAGQLKEYKPAKQDQQDAKEDLEAASKELEEALAQLRQQLQDEVLRALEERFTAMLAAQRELTITTRKLDETRQNVLTADGSLPAALGERITLVATGETDLEGEAKDALKLLEEEGTTAVFPEIIMDLRDQFHDVASSCLAYETDVVVQAKQKEIEDTLELLINALRRTIERKEGGC
jgi:chromosome segregation ATPase